MVESSKRPVDKSAQSSESIQQTRAIGSGASDTARAADSVPLPIIPFRELPMQFGRYLVRKELGRGQMGAVFLAQDQDLDRPVALKVARVSASGSAKILKRMEVEAKAAAKIDHPMICKVYDTGEIDGIRFIALQYIEGEDLKRVMKRTGRRMQPNEAVVLVTKMLNGLAAAHEKGVMHRDLKPENVMINKGNDPVIMDFGLARRTAGSSDAGLTQGMIVGTAAYMSPEQASGKAEGIDHRSDIYAVGVMLFEMLTGEWPFSGGAIEVMGMKCVQEPPSPLSVVPDLNPQLAAVCQKMIAKRKEDRFTNCQDAVAALEGASFDLQRSNDELIDFQEYSSPTFDFSAVAAGSATRKKSTDLTPPPIPVRPKSVPLRSKLAAKNDSLFWPILGGVAGAVIVLSVVIVFLFGPSSRAVARNEPSGAVAAVPERTAVERLEKLENQQQSPLAVTQNDQSKANIPVAPAVIPQTALAATPKPFTPLIADEPDEPLQSRKPFERMEPADIPDLKMPAEDPEMNVAAPNSATVKSAEATKTNSDSQSADLDNLIATAASLVKSMQGKEAMTLLRKASNLYPKEIRADFYIGLLNSGVGVNEPKVAELHFKRALDRSPGHLGTLNNLALVAFKAKKFAPARNYLELAGKMNPRPFEVNQNIGRAISQANLLGIKSDELKRISGFNTEAAAFRSNIGWMYMPVDNSSKSAEEYKTFCIRGVLDDPSCSVCSGRASVPCKACQAQGSVLVSGSVTETKNMGYGSVNTQTPTSAQLRCTVCGGRGRVDCSNCADGRDPTLSGSPARKAR